MLFSSSLSPNEKKQRLHKDFHIAMTAELLSLAKMMIQEGEAIEKIKKYTGYSIEKIREIAESMEK